VNLLLDTQVFLWLQSDPTRLGALEPTLRDRTNTLLLSAASSWEIAIKAGLGRLDLPEPPPDYVPSRMRTSGVDGIGIEHSHALKVAELPPHHRDPFDRLLIAQAQIEGLKLVSADPIFDLYDVEVVKPVGPAR
jgi:PIN domain nuclease of toxin-antitoxin system